MGTRTALSARQTMFCMLVASGVPYQEAWETSGHSKKLSFTGPWRAMKNPAILAKVAKYQAHFAEQHGITVGTILAELELTRQRATMLGQHGAAAAASMGKAKLLGFLVDKVEDITQRKPSLIPTKATEMTEEAWLKMVHNHMPGLNGGGNGKAH